MKHTWWHPRQWSRGEEVKKSDLRNEWLVGWVEKDPKYSECFNILLKLLWNFFLKSAKHVTLAASHLLWHHKFSNSQVLPADRKALRRAQGRLHKFPFGLTEPWGATEWPQAVPFLQRSQDRSCDMACEGGCSGGGWRAREMESVNTEA